MVKSLSDEQAWNSFGDSCKKLDIVPRENIIRQWLEKYFSGLDSRDKSVLEIGCYPGEYLAVFGELGYELNGIDIYAKVTRELPLWLASKNYKVGAFDQVDFFKYPQKRKFDIVCSFGFLEHFTDVREVLIKHASLVREGGYLAVTTPNYRGIVQRMLHLTLNTTVYKGYHIPSMNSSVWKKTLTSLGFEVIRCGGIGSFSFWTDCDKRNFFQKVLSSVVMHGSKALNLHKLPDSRYYSPYCGLIARKMKS